MRMVRLTNRSFSGPSKIIDQIWNIHLVLQFFWFPISLSTLKPKVLTVLIVVLQFILEWDYKNFFYKFCLENVLHFISGILGLDVLWGRWKTLAFLYRQVLRADQICPLLIVLDFSLRLNHGTFIFPRLHSDSLKERYHISQLLVVSGVELEVVDVSNWLLSRFSAKQNQKRLCVSPWKISILILISTVLT